MQAFEFEVNAKNDDLHNKIIALRQAEKLKLPDAIDEIKRMKVSVLVGNCKKGA